MKYFLSKTVNIKRLRYKLGSRLSVYSSTGTASGYPASIQEPSPAKLALYASGNISNMFDCYVEIFCPVHDGDHVVQGVNEYAVQDIKIQDFGSTHFKRLILLKVDNGN